MRTPTNTVLPTLKTNALGQELLHLAECESTNDIAAEYAATGGAHGLVVLTEFQSAGRGRRGNTWISPPGLNLTFSMVLGPLPQASALGPLVLGLGVGAAEGIQAATGCRIRLKWPNDLVADGRKLGGILGERRQDTIVAGIGINVNAAPNDDLIDRPATCLASLAGCELNRLEILARMLECIEPVWESVQASGSTEIRDRYLSQCDTIGEEVQVRLGADNTLSGRAEGLDEFGCLLVRDAAGAVHTVSSGDVDSVR